MTGKSSRPPTELIDKAYGTVRRADSLAGYRQAVLEADNLSAEDEYALASHVQATKDAEDPLVIEGRNKAIWTLVFHNAKIPVKEARKLRGYGLDEEDMIREGTDGLRRAVERFDPDHVVDGKRVRLVTYATTWIKDAMFKYAYRCFQVVGMGSYDTYKRLFFKYKDATANDAGRLSDARVNAVATQLAVKPEHVRLWAGFTQPMVPYEKTVVDDDFDGSPSTWLVDVDVVDAETEVIPQAAQDRRSELVGEARDLLTERERTVLDQRALSATGKDVKLKDLAAELGLTPARVSQIEKEAKDKVMRHVMAACQRDIDDDM